MRIAIAGSCTEKGYIEDIFRSQGVECIEASTPEQAKLLSDELPVVLLGGSAPDSFLEDDGYARRAVSGLGVREPVVFLLDYERETPDYILALVLRRAYMVAAGKRPAYVLLRSVRSGLPGMEKLYSDVRNLGATIIKYETLTLDRSDDGCEVIADDGTCKYEIHTPLLIDCAPKPDRQTMLFAKALRIRTYGEDVINSDRWFISPGRTSRRGVYYIDTGMILSGSLRDTLISIADEIKLTANTTPGIRARVDAQKCAFCYTCYRVCPHGALGPDPSAAAMKVIESLCSACGMCVAICPAKAIELAGSGPRNDEKAAGENIIAFCCENSAAIAARTSFSGRDVKVVSIPCGGNIDGERIISALGSCGRVIVAVCSDEACRHFDGSTRARKQVEKVRRAVEKLGIDPERIGFVQVSHAMPAALRAAADPENAEWRSL